MGRVVDATAAAHLRDMSRSVQTVRARPTGSTSRKDIVASIADLREAARHLSTAMYLVEYVEAEMPDDLVSTPGEVAPRDSR